MKKFIAFLLTAMLLLALTACGDNGTPYVNYGTTQPSGTGTGTGVTPSDPSGPADPANPSAPTTEPTEPVTEPVTEPTTAPTEPTEPDVPDVPDDPDEYIEISEPFTNNTNYQNAPIGDVSIQPKYVYWEDGKLIAVCFVCNGTDKTISNINVKNLSFAGNTGPLAEASFGNCTGLTLGSMTYNEWTFSFPANCVSQYGADLSHLNTAWDLTYAS